MKKIMVPLDGSELAEHALEVAGKMVDEEFSLLLVRVLNPAAVLVTDFLRQEAQDYLNDMTDVFLRKHPDVDVKSYLDEGRAAETLIDLAEQKGAGLIVMTTHGAGGLGRWIMGSVAEKVVRHAPCPVLTIGQKTLEKLPSKE